MKSLYAFSLGVMVFLLSTSAFGASFETVTVVTGSQANEVEQRYAKLLQNRLKTRTSIPVIVQDAPAQAVSFAFIPDNAVAPRKVCA